MSSSKTKGLKEIRRTRAEILLQWHAENGPKNSLFTDEKFVTIEEQYNNQNNKICLAGKKKNLMTARVSMLLKSSASPDMLPSLFPSSSV